MTSGQEMERLYSYNPAARTGQIAIIRVIYYIYITIIIIYYNGVCVRTGILSDYSLIQFSPFSYKYYRQE